MWEQNLVYVVILAAFGFFVWGRFRYDLVALSAVTVLGVAGVLEPVDLFRGFGNDAVLSVVAIMVVGRALRVAGVTEPMAALLLRLPRQSNVQTFAVATSAGFFSSFMNNTGALTVFLPVAVHVARVMHRLASSLLMPLAFASLLGGLITLIGTPPNILVSNFRERHVGEPYGMFDFTPVGIVVALVGILFLTFVGWRLVPARRGSVSHDRLLRMKNYFAEVSVPAASPMVGRPLGDFGEFELDATVVGLVRNKRRIVAPMSTELLQAGDLLLVEAAADELNLLVDRAGLELGKDRTIVESEIGSPDVVVEEIVIARGSPLQGRTAKGLRMRWRYGINILAISRQGSRIVRRLPEVRLRAGDVLLVQARAADFEDILDELKCYSIVDHEHEAPSVGRLLTTLVVFGAAMAMVITGKLSLGIAFLAAAMAVIILGVLSVREAYTAVDWSVVVLLGATIPLGTALENTGGAENIAHGLVVAIQGMSAEGALVLLMVATMLLSNVINNAATAVLMAPIAWKMALDLGVNPDTFLMATAVGASSCFMTPMGHQCNILVMGPGGYRFTDYMRVGTPLSLVVLAVAVPCLLVFWPLR